MIENIRIRNFKSLGEVSIPFSKFNCLVGMNGSGKSTVIQALDFISHLMRGDIADWLSQRGWAVHDINCKTRKESNITVDIEYRTRQGEHLYWVGVFNRTTLRCTSETIGLGHERVFQSTGQTFHVRSKTKQDITFVYQGSILSVLKDSELIDPILEFRDYILRIRSLELLSPQEMRRVARANDTDIGAGGEKLAGYLHTIQGAQRTQFIELLKVFYPNIEDFKVTNLRAGWKRLSVIERYGDQKLETEARHISDGILRIMAVLSQAGSDRSLILLDEIENGINQEIVEKLVDTLVNCEQQILVTTHSPLILNFLHDDVAREAVQFIYRAPHGESRMRHLFSIPRMSEKLECMGPGDAFVDTDLSVLAQECIALDAKEATKKER